ncbi:syntaxin-binding protein 5-like isoform X2 [Lineus longissimus]|uniref:syntaxin-binding protein 5-like isoform X2 n=1 Tax=Lineus longissimus TaxID=88925 RepID=UPI00315CE485
MSGPKNNCRMKKALKGVLDGLRVSSLSQQTRVESEIDETLRTEHFHLSKTVRHGFPYQPVSMAFDPVQHILAIGTRNGSLRIFGRPGVDCHLRHDGDIAVLQVIFLINEGALVTMCSDDTLHLWNFRQKRPAIAHSLKFQRESLTYIHLPFQSKWLYVGTERGNVHIINIESFVLSGYVINWNKAIELSRKTHPGPVVHLSDNPMDPNKLLIGFESGAIVLWDLKSKTAEHRYSCHEALRSISWHHEGRQFMCSHVDGSLTTWIARNPQKPQNILYPHAKMGKDGKPDPCKPIAKLQWCSTKSGEPFVIFSGGMSYDKAGRTPSITVMHGKNTTVLEMEHSVTDFVTLAETPWSNDFQEPYGIVVLLDNDLVVVDLTTEGYPCFENPYPMDIHESPVTACYYFADCPTDLIPAFYSVGSKQKKSGFSEKDWPIRGGEWGTSTCSYPEIMITGHADGSVKIWDATSVTLQVLYKLKTAKVFERPRSKPEKGQEPDEDPFAIQNIFLDAESRVLTIAGLTHVLVFKFSKQESIIDLPFLEISLVYEVFDDLDSPDIPEFPKPNTGLVPQHSSSVGSYSSTASDSRSENLTSIKVKQGCRKWSSGYQPEIVCLLTYVDGEPASSITSISVNSSYGLLAFGNESGLAIVDIIQKTCLLNMGTPDLYGSLDPYQRVPRSPKSKKAPECVGQSSTEENKSPTSDQCLSPPCQPVAPPRRQKSSHRLECITEDKNHLESKELLQTYPKSDTKFSFEEGLNEKRRQLVQTQSSYELGVKKPARPPPPRLEGLKSCSDHHLHHPEEFKKQPARRVKSNEDRLDLHSSLQEAQLQAFGTNHLNTVEITKSCTPTSTGTPEHLSDDDITDEEGIRLRDHQEERRTSFVRNISTKIRNLTRRKSENRISLSNSGRYEDEDFSSRKVSQSLTVDVIDLRCETVGEKPPVMKMQIGTRKTSADKNDGSFSRSRSSSMSSLENISKEAIQCLSFADAYTRKTGNHDSYTCPCLWVGTSLGSVLVINLQLPIATEARQTEPVTATPSGTIFRLKGTILAMSFLDCNGILIPAISEQWKDFAREMEKDKGRTPSKLPRQVSVNKPRMSPTSSTEILDRQFAIICSEKQARVMSLPSQTCAYKVKITETSFVIKADVVNMKDSVCLTCYVANGHLMAFSLPSLKPLLDVDFLPLTDLRIARTFSISNNGHALFFCSPTEVQKLTYAADMCENLQEMLGELFLPVDAPEPPKQGFFKNLFSGGGASLDREELFGESSGKASKGLAKHIPGSGLQGAQEQAGAVLNDFQRTRQALTERGEKLGELDERTAQMMAEAQSYASASHTLMERYKNRRWYQF